MSTSWSIPLRADDTILCEITYELIAQRGFDFLYFFSFNFNKLQHNSLKNYRY